MLCDILLKKTAYILILLFCDNFKYKKKILLMFLNAVKHKYAKPQKPTKKKPKEYSFNSHKKLGKFKQRLQYFYTCIKNDSFNFHCKADKYN